MEMIGVDLFAGAGGMSLGARQAGIDVQIVVEADPHAAATYQRNHNPKLGLFADDIRKFNKLEIPNRDNKSLIVFGGPPCQGFSTSNQKTRNSQNSSNWLFQEFLRIVKSYSPEWVVFENVKGILETESGLFVDYVLDSLNAMGYSTKLCLLNAESYGVPQKRERLFIVANINGVIFTPPKESSIRVTVDDAIGDLPVLDNGANTCYRPYRTAPHSSYAKKMRKKNKSSGCHNNLVSRNAEFILERYPHIPQGGNWEDIPENLMKNYKDRTRCHTGIYRRLVADSASVVIGNYRKNMLVHPYQHRGLSVREAARLQSFPDDFIFEGSIGFQQQQVGNAVPPLLAKALFEQIVKQHG